MLLSSLPLNTWRCASFLYSANACRCPKTRQGKDKDAQAGACLQSFALEIMPSFSFLLWRLALLPAAVSDAVMSKLTDIQLTGLLYFHYIFPATRGDIRH